MEGDLEEEEKGRERRRRTREGRERGLEKGEGERQTRVRKDMGWIGMQGPWSRAGGPVSRPLPASTVM